MRRYFFNVHAETYASPDLVGLRLLDDDAATAEARAVAGEIAKVELARDDWPANPWVEVLDHDQRQVAVIPAGAVHADPTSWE